MKCYPLLCCVSVRTSIAFWGGERGCRGWLAIARRLHVIQRTLLVVYA